MSSLTLLKPVLERLYADYNRVDSAADPVHLVRRYAEPADREIAGFCAAGLAFGRVASVLQSAGALLDVMGDSPARFVRAFDPSRDGRAVRKLGHRWTRGVDLAALLWVLRQMLEQAGSVEGFFLAGYDRAAPDLAGALDSFCRRALALDVRAVYGRRAGQPGIAYFFPRPADGSGCKRLNLFLRWMVRRDELDLGVWRAVSPSQLLIPLDTHVIRVGRCLGLTRYRSPGWRMAAEITASLRQIDQDDPIKYDFALCHVGMLNLCGFGRSDGHGVCPLKRHCEPRVLPTPDPTASARTTGRRPAPAGRRASCRPPASPRPSDRP